jgi:hypothetical protein
MHVPAHYLASAAICQPRDSAAYLPLLLSFGAVDVALDDVLGVADDDELMLPDDGVDDDDVSDDGGVDALDGLLDDDALLSLELGAVDDGDDDIEPLVAGGVVVVVDDDDVDGDGVTTGGVVLFVDGVSRLHPATPTTMPLTSNAINAVFIAISKSIDEGLPPAGISTFDAMESPRVTAEFPRRINGVANRLRSICRPREGASPDVRRPICIGGR